MNFEKFNQYIKETDLKILNEILKEELVSEVDKKNLFFIAYYMLNEGYKDDNMTLLSTFIKQNKQRQCFGEIVTIMKQEIDKVIYYTNSYSKIKEEREDLTCKITPKESKEELIRRIRTTLSSSRHMNNVSHNEYFEIIKILLYSKVPLFSEKLYNEIFKNYKLIYNFEKIKIVLEVLNEKTECSIESSFAAEIIDALTEKDLFEIDKDSYKELVELATNGIQSVVLSKVLKEKRLTFSKKESLIKYLSYMMPKYLPKYIRISKQEAEKHYDNPIFKVVCSERLLSIDNFQYKEILQDIQNSDKPFSYARIELSDNLTNEQREYAKYLINKGGNTKFAAPDFGKYPRRDYKVELAQAATSPILTKFDIASYKRVLYLMNSLCQKTDNEYNSDYQQFEKDLELSRNIVELLYKEKLYNLYQSNPTRIMDFLEKVFYDERIKKAIKFCIDDNSIYYTDFEYEEAIEIINEVPDSKTYSVISLFTNANIAFISDKEQLFKIAREQTENEIDSIYEQLYTIGRHNQALQTVFDGIETSLIENITGSKNIKIRTLEKNNVKRISN